MQYNRLLGVALALSICGSAGSPRAEASKVSIGEQAIRKQLAADSAQAEKTETAGLQRELEAQPAVRAKPSEPVRYDALPEHDRKMRPADELLGAVAEV